MSFQQNELEKVGLRPASGCMAFYANTVWTDRMMSKLRVDQQSNTPTIYSMRCIPRWIHFRSTLSVLLSPQYSETESVAAKSPSSANNYAEQQHREEWTVGQRGHSQYGFPWDKKLGAIATLSPIGNLLPSFQINM